MEKPIINSYNAYLNWPIDTFHGELGIRVLNTIYNRDQYNKVIEKIRELVPEADCYVTQIRENVVIRNFKDLKTWEQWALYELSMPGIIIEIVKDSRTC